MTTYLYQNKETGEVIEKRFPMSSDIPSTVIERGKTYKRKWSGTAVHIPDDWGENQIRFDKSPSRRKHFY